MVQRLFLLSVFVFLGCGGSGSPCGPRFFQLVNYECPPDYTCVDRDITGCVFNCGPFCVAGCSRDDECSGGCTCSRFGEVRNTCTSGSTSTTTTAWLRCEHVSRK